LKRISTLSEDDEAKIARIVGFEDLETYRRAKEIYLQGIPELIKAVDYKKISIEEGAKIARLKKEEQHRILKSLTADSI
jgi:hypothetical protein